MSGPDEIRRPTLVALLLGVAIVAVAVAVWRRPAPSSSPGPRPAGGDLTIAFTGDTVVTGAVDEWGSDAGFASVTALLQQATLAVTNLEMALFVRPPAGPLEPSGWPYGDAGEATTLARAGFDVVTRANNRAADFGADGLEQTGTVLDSAGIRHVGAGRTLAGARTAIVVNPPQGAVAFFSVSVSASAESRATDARGEIAGRPGISSLRFAANITVDEATFATLKSSAPALQAEAQVGERELTLFGRTIKRGEQTLITFTVDDADQAAILSNIEAARKVSPIVILALHSHEPSNHVDSPAEFVRAFAARAIDRGASLVVGHGPHRLRGVEQRPGGVILHSLGNFVYPYEPLAVRDADLFDSGLDQYGLALGAVDATERRTPAPMEADAWWESIIAVASFRDGALTAVTLHPIDLGTDRALERRGTPRLAEGAAAARILTRLAALSAPFETTIAIEGGVGTVAAGAPRAK